MKSSGSRRPAETPLARSQRIDAKLSGGEVLELVDIEREIAALVLWHAPPRLGRLRACGDEKRAEQVRGLGAEIAFREIDDEHFTSVHHVGNFEASKNSDKGSIG